MQTRELFTEKGGTLIIYGVTITIEPEVEAQWLAHIGPERVARLRETLTMLREITDPFLKDRPVTLERLPDGALDADADHWLAPNEILGARGARDKWVTQDDLEDVEAAGFAGAMRRTASNLRHYCSDVIRGDWSIYDEAHRWYENSAGV